MRFVITDFIMQSRIPIFWKFRNNSRYKDRDSEAIRGQKMMIRTNYLYVFVCIFEI